MQAMAGSTWSTAMLVATHAYLDELRPTLGLSDWTVVVDAEPLPVTDGEAANIEILYAQQHATIRLAADFAEQTPAWQRHTLVHELVHCHLAQLTELVADIGQAGLTRSAAAVADAAVAHSVEQVTDRLAIALVDRFDVPDLPRTGTKAGTARARRATRPLRAR